MQVEARRLPAQFFHAFSDVARRAKTVVYRLEGVLPPVVRVAFVEAGPDGAAINQQVEAISARTDRDVGHLLSREEMPFLNQSHRCDPVYGSTVILCVARPERRT